ncbi:zinc finger protein 878-like isoform X2 [Artemia franciscana]|uniref:zinc finger protein 878-like isoform X2 n=1 Tax=Artemia franciscana TaxID=6661 RepID=UPI0032DB502E
MAENRVQMCETPDKELGIDFLDEESLSLIENSHPEDFKLEKSTIQKNNKVGAPNCKREEKDGKRKIKGATSETQKSSLSERLRRKTVTATLYCSMDESSQSSDNEDSFEREDGKNHKHPAQKDGSVFTLEMIAKFLQQDLVSLDKDKWENMIKNVHDVNLFQDIVSLGNGRRRYKCYKCQKQIHGTPIEMEEHMKHVHSSSLAFGCFFCPLARSTARELFRHENYHVHWSRNVVCTICDYGHLSTPEFKDIDWPALHQICHPPTDVISQWSPEQQLNWFECLYPGCNYSPKRATIRRLAFAKHVAIYHAPGNKSCVICGESGMNDWKLKTHLRCCMLKQLDPVKCPDCGASMKDARKKHDCKSGIYDCKDCQSKFVDPSSLRRHTLNVHGNKSHPCDVCGKTFVTRKSLEAEFHQTYFCQIFKVREPKDFLVQIYNINPSGV